MPASLENSPVARGLKKISLHSNYRTIAFISHASKVMLKILQGRLQQYGDRELPEVQAGFQRGRGTRDWIANMRWIMESSRKTSISASLTTQKPLTVSTTTNYGKFLKEQECLTSLPISWKIYMLDRKQHLALDMEQLIGSKLGK